MNNVKGRNLLPLVLSIFVLYIYDIIYCYGEDMFANGFHDDGSFPIGVWLQSPDLAPRYKAIGINTYVGLWEGPTEKQLGTLARHKMFAVTNQNGIALRSVHNHVIRGWLDAIDEPDNAQPIGLGLYGRCIPAKDVARRSREMRNNDPTRPIVVGFGQGVANEGWKGRGSCNGDRAYYEIAAEGADILSFDIYPVGSTDSQVKGKLEYVALGVSYLTKIAGGGRKVWNAIEASALDPNRPVVPAEVRAEVWMSLIHGSTGIIYFVHEFKPFREDGIFRHPLVADEIKKINSQIQAMAPVLRSPSIGAGPEVVSTVPLATMVKQFNGTLYVFAVAMRNEANNARITLPNCRCSQAEVVGENRSIQISDRRFEDHFTGYGVHIYKIALEE